ncbi:MAG: hypothetical protein KME43_18310 [Myxacorys chilensis ATA2-1-KO14]|jgi:hypothetical protein|nr:hypothetical protein [Myxacorys chilensis ATA2-1-KO14]
MSISQTERGRLDQYAPLLDALEANLDGQLKKALQDHKHWRRTAQTDLRYTSPADSILSDYFTTLIDSSRDEADLKEGLHGFYARSLDQITTELSPHFPQLDSELPPELRSQLLNIGAQQLLNETLAADPQFLGRLHAAQRGQNLDRLRRWRDFLARCIGQHLSLEERFNLGLLLGLLPIKDLLQFMNERHKLGLTESDQATIEQGLELSRTIARGPLTYKDAIAAIQLFRSLEDC